MRQAILITGYKNVDSFLEIIDFFGAEFRFYLHIDRKSKLDLSPLQALSNVFLSRRYVVNWGGVNHLKAILLLAKTALEDHKNGFFHLITAEDFPVKTPRHFAELDTSKCYIDYFEVPSAQWGPLGGMERIDYYNPYDLLNAKIPLQYTAIRAISALQKRLELKRPYPVEFSGLKLYGGSTYWSMGRDALGRVIRFTCDHEAFLNRFDHTFAAEEFYFQTLILNSRDAVNVVNDNLRYIQWVNEGQTPKFLDLSDYDRIIASNKLFARKFGALESMELKTRLRQELQDPTSMQKDSRRRCPPWEPRTVQGGRDGAVLRRLKARDEDVLVVAPSDRGNDSRPAPTDFNFTHRYFRAPPGRAQ